MRRSVDFFSLNFSNKKFTKWRTSAICSFLDPRKETEMSDTKLSPEVLELLEKVRVAVVEKRLSDAAVHMIEVRRLIDEAERKGGDNHVSLG